MCQICRNTLVDHARKQSTRAERLVRSEADDTIQAIVEAVRAPENEEPEHALARLGLLTLIQTTLDYLPVHYGNVLEWKYVEGLSVEEIAKQLSIGPKAAESLLTRARVAFKEAILSINESGDLLPSGLGSTKG